MTAQHIFTIKRKRQQKHYWSEIETIKPVTQIPAPRALRQIIELLKRQSGEVARDGKTFPHEFVAEISQSKKIHDAATKLLHWKFIIFLLQCFHSNGDISIDTTHSRTRMMHFPSPHFSLERCIYDKWSSKASSKGRKPRLSLVLNYLCTSECLFGARIDETCFATRNEILRESHLKDCGLHRQQTVKKSIGCAFRSLPRWCFGVERDFHVFYASSHRYHHFNIVLWKCSCNIPFAMLLSQAKKL